MDRRGLRVVEGEGEGPVPGPELLEEIARCLREALTRVSDADSWLRDFLAAELRHAELLLRLESLPVP